MNYYSPELVRYIQGTADGAELTEASDVFALGLIYAEYLTGALPAFDPAFHEAAIAVLNGDHAPAPPGGRAATHRGTGGTDAAGRPRRTPHRRTGPRHPDGMAQRRAHHRGAAEPPPPITGPPGGRPVRCAAKGLRLAGATRRTPADRPCHPGRRLTAPGARS